MSSVEIWYFRGDVVEGAEASDEVGATSPAEDETRAAFDAVRRHHGALRAERYGIPASASSCSRAAAAAIGERFAHLARLASREGETFEAVVDRVARAGVAKWFGRPGHNDFLKRNNHPLERLGEAGDLDFVTAELGLHRHKPAAAPTAGPVRQGPTRAEKFTAIDHFRRTVLGAAA